MFRGKHCLHPHGKRVGQSSKATASTAAMIILYFLISTNYESPHCASFAQRQIMSLVIRLISHPHNLSALILIIVLLKGALSGAQGMLGSMGARVSVVG
jgi:hypothetical protein